MNKYKLLIPFLVILTLMVASTILHCQTVPLATMSFDENMDADTPSGKVSPVLQGNPILVPGRHGKALKSGPDTGYLEFPSSLLNLSAGTVEMWVCPLDWNEKSEEFHVFFDVKGNPGALYLYKYHEIPGILMLACADTNGPFYSSVKQVTWKAGEWHHIAGTWSPLGVMVYVDGQPAGSSPIEARLPASLAESFVVGDNPWHISRKTSSLLDDVRIYGAALSPAHIAAHYSGDYSLNVPLSKDTLQLHAEIDPDKKTVQVRVNTGGADIADSDLSAQVALVSKGSGFPSDASIFNFKSGHATASLPVDISKPADYVLMVRIVPKGGSAITLQKDIIVPDLVTWKNNRIGLEDVVLPPWTPVKQLANGVLGVWDRKYDFTSAGLFGQAYSGGQKLLARPIEIRQKINGKDSSLKSGKVNTVASKPTRVTLRKVLTSAKSRITLDAYTEYDGLMLLTLTGRIDPAAESVTIDIPVRPEIATYRHRAYHQWNSSPVTGNLPKGKGAVDNDHFVPYYWLGNNERGLFWFCETDEYWPNSESSNALQVVRENSEVVLRLNILAKGQKLPDSWKFTFGLQATPVKPMPANWRKWRLEPTENHMVHIIWPTPEQDSTTYFGYPEATNPQVMTDRINKLQQQKVAAVPYLCLTFLSSACPEWPFFKKYWAMGPVDNSSADVVSYGSGFAMVSPVGLHYADFIIWKTAEFMKRYNVDGLYHDCTNPNGTTALDAGVGYKRGDTLRPTYPIMAYRELYRRIYAVAKKFKPNSFTMAHMSASMVPPILAYEDSYLDGEHFRGYVKGSYMDLISLDTFRAEFMGKQWGIIPVFLPEFDEENRTRPEPTRGLMALLMLHDVNPWAIWCNVAEVNKPIKALDQFGYIDSKYIGYYEKQPPASTIAKDVHISAYKKPGKTLLIVGNVGKSPRTADIKLNSAVLGKVKSVVTWPEQKPVQVKNGAIQIKVQGLDYALLLIR